MRYVARHVTRYRYEGPVAQCLTEARITPRELAYQHVSESRIKVQPEPAFFEERVDYFGNRVAAFSVFRTHDHFAITCESTVDVLPRAQEFPLLAWQDAQARLISPSSATGIEATEFIFDSPFVVRSAELAAFAEPSFPKGRPLCECLQDLNTRIHREFQYRPHSTTIEIPLAEVLRLRRGVCQDFAHIMIGALRSLNLPARYVSGYLRSGAQYQGAEASHAWVAAFVPDFGWLDLDPTNNVLPGEGHITLGWGRDYGDVTPVKGISLGGGGQKIEVAVNVQPLTA